MLQTCLCCVTVTPLEHPNPMDRQGMGCVGQSLHDTRPSGQFVPALCVCLLNNVYFAVLELFCLARWWNEKICFHWGKFSKHMAAKCCFLCRATETLLKCWQKVQSLICVWGTAASPQCKDSPASLGKATAPCPSSLTYLWIQGILGRHFCHCTLLFWSSFALERIFVSKFFSHTVFLSM